MRTHKYIQTDITTDSKRKKSPFQITFVRSRSFAEMKLIFWTCHINPITEKTWTAIATIPAESEVAAAVAAIIKMRASFIRIGNKLLLHYVDLKWVFYGHRFVDYTQYIYTDLFQFIVNFSMTNSINFNRTNGDIFQFLNICARTHTHT